MKRRAVLIAAVVGLLLAADAPKDGAPKRAEEEREYAKVELKGRFYVRANLPRSKVPEVIVQGDVYELDLSQNQELQGDALRKLEGELVVVTGTLTLPPDSKSPTRVLVTSLRVVKP